MRRLLSIITLSLCALSLGAANRASKDLAKVLVAMAKEQSIHPDSLYPHIKSLEVRKDACVDPTEKAVMRAALGYLYHQRSYRSVANVYLSDMDSTDMKTWSRDEWDRMAALRYSEALSDLDLLHRAKLSQWAPLLTRGKHDKIFDNDMLMLVWRSAQEVSYHPRAILPSRANIIEYYKKLGNRRAVLVLTLDGLGLFGERDRAELLRLKDEYADLEECGEVYYRLAKYFEKKDSAKVVWLQEGIKRYPRYAGVNELKYMLQQNLQHPRCQWSMETERPYPGQTYNWTFLQKNVTKVGLQVYRVSPDFDEDALNNAKAPFKYLKKGIRRGLVAEVTDCWPDAANGNKVELTEAGHFAPWEEVRDTLQWKAPAPGRYVLVMQPSTNAKLAEKVQPSIRFFDVTRLMVNQFSLPGDRQRIVVTDAMTGRPLEGVSVDLFKEEPRVHGIKSKPGSVYYAHLKTDHEGKVDVDFPKDAKGNRRSDVGIHVECPDDFSHPNGHLGSAYYESYDPNEDKEETLNLYTDRSIYRPGQTVHVGGVLSYRKQWDEKVVAGESLTLKLYNPNQKEVGKVEATTDSLGVFSADFQLPENGLPGSYRLSTNRKSISIRVEEYKRPTFEVKIEDAPAIQMPVDSITLTGVALNYNGAPVRSAQVVGNFRFRAAYRYWLGWHSGEIRYDEKTDTVLTDAEGRFRVTIPIRPSKSDLYDGQMLSVQYVVTSPTGETHTAEQSVYLSSKPVRLFANVPSQNDKDKPENWRLLLISSTGKELQGDVQLTFEAKHSRENDPSKSRNVDSSISRPLGSSSPQVPDSSTPGSTVYSCTVKSGSAIRPDFLQNVPSGAYLLKMQSVLNGDTATAEQDIVVFSQHDTRLVNKSKLWLYVPEISFSSTHPARIMVGTSEKAYIYYTLNSNDELVESRLIQLCDSVLTIDIPYEKRYGQGLLLNVMTVLGNQVYKERRMLVLKEPDKQIRYKWTTFRDKLQPGQKETWQLQLKRPDGRPASANLMASLYDASLDAIHSHSWNIWHHLSNNVLWRDYSCWFQGHWSYLESLFVMKNYASNGYTFSTFNDDLFHQLQYGYVKKLPRKATRAKDGAMYGTMKEVVRMESAPMVLRGEVKVRAKATSTGDFAGMATTSVDESLQGRIAGLDVVSTSNELGTGAAGDGFVADDIIWMGEDLDANDPVVSLRENFNETAFFYPALRTDAEGNVNIEFTLPESLTTWRLLGLAHTQDMLTTLLDEKVVAQKDLMAQLSLPRFLRQGDKASLSATIFNISERSLKGRAVLTILDAATEKVMLKQRVNFDLRAKSDSVYHVPFNVPDDCGMLIVRWAAETTAATSGAAATVATVSSGSPQNLCSDGEQRYLPVLSSKEWITDTRALTYTKAGTYTEDIEKLFPVKSATNRQLTVEYVSQPAWYAIQALPSLAWPQSSDVLSLTTAYYAGALSGNITQKNPLIGQTIEKWKAEGKMQKSKLLQNEELKNILLDETPWIALAEQETERIQRLSTLFDEATQNSLQKEYLDKIRKLQNGDGSFSWYPGMKGNYYMTREVAYILTRLKVLTGKAPEIILSRAVNYIREDRPTYLGTSSLRYLYVLYNSGVQMDKKDKHNADSLMKVMIKHPENLDLEQRALAAIVLHKAGKTKDAMRYLESVKQFLVTNDEGLTYFEFPEGSFTSINRKQHIHVQAMEAIMMLDPKATSYSSSGVGGLAVDGMRRYLLRHKRTSEWDTPVNSANAVYALLLSNANLLQQGSDATLTLTGKSGKNQLPEEESSFGFIRQRVDIGQATGQLANGSTSQQAQGASSVSISLPAVPRTLTVEKRGDHESWGGIYTQYLAPVADVQASKSGLNIRREQPAASKEASSQSLSVGSRIHTRYVIEADRDYEYVAVNIPRAATTEPADQLSGYQWQHGLAYYRAVRDASTQYFIDYLPRGTYVIEEELLVERPGEYSAGIATIQCLYAPEFSAHTNDTRIVVRKK
ncbi:MAG: MG2 domain-containing protein [Bacteroidaceae bacterium]|nr:MG2 domain-containing protein [Bacteroidaceae bacterium]